MASKVINALLLATILLFGCTPSFHALSKKIAKSYEERNYRVYDLEHNHPLRMFLKKKGGFTNYNINRDTLIFAQYSDRHEGNVATAVILNGIKSFPFDKKNQNGKTDSSFFPRFFLDAITTWDTVYLSSIPEEKSFHKAIIYIARITKGRVAVLPPRTYDLKK